MTKVTNIHQYFSYYIIVNDKTVATDEVYFATEHGCILVVDFHNMCLFRKTTLHNLIEQTETTIARMGRPNNIMDRARNRRDRDDMSFSAIHGARTDRSAGSQRGERS